MGGGTTSLHVPQIANREEANSITEATTATTQAWLTYAGGDDIALIHFDIVMSDPEKLPGKPDEVPFATSAAKPPEELAATVEQLKDLPAPATGGAHC